MSAIALFHIAMRDALKIAPDFGGVINGVFEGPAVKASEPFAEIGELLVADWGTKDSAGVELRSAIIIRDRAEGPGRVHALAAAADAAMVAMPRALESSGEGWQIVTLVLLRTRIIRTAPGLWAAMIEHRARLIQE